MIRTRTTLVTIALISFPLFANADSPPTTEEIYFCVDIIDDKERLNCYDLEVGKLRAAETAGDITTISKSEVENLQKDSFGFSLPTLAKGVLPKFGSNQNQEILSVEERVTSIRKLPLGKLLIRLENGQVWEQTDSRRIIYSSKRGVERAEIKRAALGSFKMKLDGGIAFRAKRVQ
jgi:hypothetical protein